MAQRIIGIDILAGEISKADAKKEYDSFAEEGRYDMVAMVDNGKIANIIPNPKCENPSLPQVLYDLMNPQ